MRQQPQDIIAEIAADNSRLAKEAVIERVMSEGYDEFFEGIKLCYDALVTFGVKDVPESDNPAGQGLAWGNFLELATALRKRELTGHAARDAINLAIGVATADQWNGWYRRILIKDMRAGFTETTVNKIAKKLKKDEYKIPVFECQLAVDANDHQDKMTGKVLVDRKYDGTRALVFLDYANHTVSIFSRNGKEFLNFGHIQKAFEPLIDVFARDTVLDGEIISKSFQELMKQARRKEDADASDARMIVFDIVPAFEFRAGKSTMRQRNRLRFLQEHANAIKETGVAEVIESKEFDLDSLVDKIAMEDFMKRVVDEEKLEGIMIKKIDAVYECKRGTNWMKIKPKISVDLTIEGVEEGTGKNKGRLGALVCGGEDQGRKIRSNVGSGFTDKQRDEIWAAYQADPDSVLGQVVEVDADCLTLNQDSSDLWSLRFPRLNRFRGFKKGEKL